jgi:hypothetical protein
MKIVQFQVTKTGQLYVLSDEGKLYIRADRGFHSTNDFHNVWAEIDHPVENKKDHT